MSLSQPPEIARSFLEWTTDEVLKWLSTLSLTYDYSSHFREHNITGIKLIKLNPAALDTLGILEGADRVKILQQITTMRADLIPTSSFSSLKRNRSPLRTRRFSETVRPQYRGGGSMQTTGTNTLKGTFSPTKLPFRDTHTPRMVSPGSISDQMSINSANSSRMSSPVKLMNGSVGNTTPDACSHFILETEEEEGGGGEGGGGGGGGSECVLRGNAADLRDHRVRRLSRSLDRLLQDPDCPPLEHRDSCNSHLVEILREENTTLKKELEKYYLRVRKLQKLEQEVERIREAHTILEASMTKREQLETAMRRKLEAELRKARESNLQLKAADLHSARRQGSGKSSQKREIARRDTMIMRLIKQNQDGATVRERLEQDLHSTKAALRQRANHTGQADTAVSDSQDRRPSSESKAALMYSESIEKLRSVIVAMQSTSERREKLEKRMRSQLEKELKQLRGERWEGGGGEEEEGEGVERWRQRVVEQEGKIAALEADVAKWEQKCLELVADKQMALESAVIPRDTRITQLERSLAEQEDGMQELKQQRSKYIAQLSEDNRRIAELEARISSLQSSVEEKDSVIHMLQLSFLDPEDQLQHTTTNIMDSPPLYHLPPSGSPHLLPRGRISGKVPGNFPPNQREVVHNGIPPPLLNGVTNTVSERYRAGGDQLQGSSNLLCNGHSRSAPTTPRSKIRKPKLSSLPFPSVSSSTPNSATSSPANTRRRLKSKTPPPGYRVTSTQKHEGLRQQRHQSVDRLLDGMESPTVGSQNGHLDLFESLLGDSLPPTSAATPLINSSYAHRHSKSSPTSDRLHL